MFVIGSIIVQMYIDTLLFLGIVALLLGWMLTNSYVDLKRSESTLADFEAKAKELEIKVKEMIEEEKQKDQTKKKDN